MRALDSTVEAPLFLALVHAVAAAAQVRVRLGLQQIRAHHFGDELLEADARLPTQLLPCLGGVAEEGIDLCGTEVARIDRDNAPSPGVDPLLALPLAAPAHPDANLRRGSFH